jgi:hypothetical protein
MRHPYNDEEPVRDDHQEPTEDDGAGSGGLPNRFDTCRIAC